MWSGARPPEHWLVSVQSRARVGAQERAVQGACEAREDRRAHEQPAGHTLGPSAWPPGYRTVPPQWDAQQHS